MVTHLLRDALGNQRELDALLGIQLGQAHVEHLEKQRIIPLVHIQLPVACGDEDRLERLVLAALDRRPRVARAGIHCVEPEMRRLDS